jgi:TetR/AcrR family transcriptional regulator, transcriptional repressor for nem operon
MVAAITSPPARMQEAVVRFFNDNETWLDRVLREGVRDHAIEIRATPSETARSIVSSLEAGMLVARLYGDVATLQAVVDGLLAGLRLSSPVAAGGSVED